VLTEDLVFTSGVQRSLFPPDVPVGRVVDVAPSADRLTQELTVEPLEDLTRLLYVVVLLWEPQP
jgi:cell shape-determining protein MreC